MSEQKHTPEPWIIVARGNEVDGVDYFVNQEKDDSISGTIASWLSREDARRIVACVNALAGIPTHFLEESASDAMSLEVARANARSLKVKLFKAERQRDQLLAALKEARRWLNGDSWRNGNLSERKCWEEFTTLIDETITAVEGDNQS